MTADCTYVGGRIGGGGRLLGGGRLPVRGHLALAGGVRVHGVGGGVGGRGRWAGVVDRRACVRGWGRPATWSCQAVMNQCNSGQRVRAGGRARCGGAGDGLGREAVSQILAARKDGCRSARAVQTASRERSRRAVGRAGGQRACAVGVRRAAERQCAVRRPWCVGSGQQSSREEGKASRSARGRVPRAWKRERRFRSLAGWWPLLLPTAPPEVPNLLAVLTGMALAPLHCGHAANECIGSSQSAI